MLPRGASGDRAYARWQSHCKRIFGQGHGEGALLLNFWICSPRSSFFLQDRKQILKVLKPHIEKICLDDEAQTVLFTALDVIE